MVVLWIGVFVGSVFCGFVLDFILCLEGFSVFNIFNGRNVFEFFLGDLEIFFFEVRKS